mgnify:FL=1
MVMDGSFASCRCDGDYRLGVENYCWYDGINAGVARAIYWRRIKFT